MSVFTGFTHDRIRIDMAASETCSCQHVKRLGGGKMKRGSSGLRVNNVKDCSAGREGEGAQGLCASHRYFTYFLILSVLCGFLHCVCLSCGDLGLPTFCGFIFLLPVQRILINTFGLPMLVSNHMGWGIGYFLLFSCGSVIGGCVLNIRLHIHMRATSHFLGVFSHASRFRK